LESVLSRSSICSVAVPLLFLLVPIPIRAQEPPRETPPEPTQEGQPGAEAKPQEPPRPPEGILPLGEIARLSFAPSDRPRVFLQENRFVIVTASGAVEAHDAGSGEFRWKLGLPGEALFAPVLHRSDPFEILLSSASGRLFFVDAETGEIRRETQLPFELALAPLVDLPLLYLGTPSGDVVAYDAEKGSERFRAHIGEAPLALASSGELIVASGSERMLTGIDVGRGGERWRLRGRSGFHAPAVFAQDRLYIGNDAGEFYCLALPSGDTQFRWATGASIRFAALVEERFVYVTSFGNDLYAYQARGGAERYRVSLPGRPASGPVRFGRRLVVATYDGAIVEMDPQKGAVAKTYEAPGELAAPPAFLAVLPSPGTDWWAAHRIGLALRTGEVLLLGHRPGAEEEKEEKEPEPPPPGKTATTQEDSLSWK
jgi:outer membrane protein assembly factor BamB